MISNKYETIYLSKTFELPFCKEKQSTRSNCLSEYFLGFFAKTILENGIYKTLTINHLHLQPYCHILCLFLTIFIHNINDYLIGNNHTRL